MYSSRDTKKKQTNLTIFGSFAIGVFPCMYHFFLLFQAFSEEEAVVRKFVGHRLSAAVNSLKRKKTKLPKIYANRAEFLLDGYYH